MCMYICLYMCLYTCICIYRYMYIYCVDQDRGELLVCSVQWSSIPVFYGEQLDLLSYSVLLLSTVFWFGLNCEKG